MKVADSPIVTWEEGYGSNPMVGTLYITDDTYDTDKLNSDLCSVVL